MQLELTVSGKRYVVTRGTDHPEHYMYVQDDGRTFFLGVWVPGTTTQGSVKEMVREWLIRRSVDKRVQLATRLP